MSSLSEIVSGCLRRNELPSFLNRHLFEPFDSTGSIAICNDFPQSATACDPAQWLVRTPEAGPGKWSEVLCFQISGLDIQIE